MDIISHLRLFYNSYKQALKVYLAWETFPPNASIAEIALSGTISGFCTPTGLEKQVSPVKYIFMPCYVNNGKR